MESFKFRTCEHFLWKWMWNCTFLDCSCSRYKYSPYCYLSSSVSRFSSHFCRSRFTSRHPVYVRKVGISFHFKFTVINMCMRKKDNKDISWDATIASLVCLEIKAQTYWMSKDLWQSFDITFLLPATKNEEISYIKLKKETNRIQKRTHRKQTSKWTHFHWLRIDGFRIQEETTDRRTSIQIVIVWQKFNFNNITLLFSNRRHLRYRGKSCEKDMAKGVPV